MEDSQLLVTCNRLFRKLLIWILYYWLPCGEESQLGSGDCKSGVLDLEGRLESHDLCVLYKPLLKDLSIGNKHLDLDNGNHGARCRPPDPLNSHLEDQKEFRKHLVLDKFRLCQWNA